MDWKAGWPLLKDTIKEWQDDNVVELGAALAYYTIFSLAPLLFVAIAIAGMVYGRDAVEGRLVSEIQGLIGQQGAQAVQTMLAHIWRQGASGFAAAIGVVTILFGASGVFGQLQSSLNRIWEVAPKPERAIWGYLKARFLSFGMVLGIGFLLLVSLVVSAALAALSAYAIGLLPSLKILFQVLGSLVSFAVITLLFAMMFRFLPDVRISWRDVWIGSAVTALLFEAGKFLIGLYLGRSSVTSAYGAAGSLVVILLWVYYSSQILFFGAEFTQVYARRYGQRILPSPHAVRIKRVQVEGNRAVEEHERKEQEAAATGQPAPPPPVPAKPRELEPAERK